ncbi:hypothetical protein UlMin_003668, partial [Ulmus minor]
YIVTCVNDIRMLILFSKIISAKGATKGNIDENKNCLSEKMKRSCLELLHMSQLLHLLKELPTEVVSSNAVKILNLIECSDDVSFNQCLNYRLLGFRLSESKSQSDNVNAVLEKIAQVVTHYDCLDEYLKVVDAFVDTILQNKIDSHLKIILEGISKRTCGEGTKQNYFLEILDLMYGSSRSIVNMHILDMATSPSFLFLVKPLKMYLKYSFLEGYFICKNGCTCDPTTIQLLFEISQALHDGVDFLNVKDADNQPAHIISRFVNMVDYGSEMEHHLTFLVECRGAFGSINGLKDILIHSSNCLAIKALRYGNKHLAFVKSCIAFCEVTLPSISSQIRQLNLYLETAEVALLGGLVSHVDGLISSTISCWQSLEIIDVGGAPENGEFFLTFVRGFYMGLWDICFWDSYVVVILGGITYFDYVIFSLLTTLSISANAWPLIAVCGLNCISNSPSTFRRVKFHFILAENVECLLQVSDVFLHFLGF